MTQEEKQLLLQDLCARLPYGVQIHYHWYREGNTIDEDRELDFSDVETLKYNIENPQNDWCEISWKPYLRPMDDMTEEEKKDILQSLNIHGDIDNEGNLLLGVECNIITLKVCKKYLGELNKRMFDVCHMIEKGLAIEAPKGMYQ